jgi:hypothetical protein
MKGGIVILIFRNFRAFNSQFIKFQENKLFAIYVRYLALYCFRHVATRIEPYQGDTVQVTAFLNDNVHSYIFYNPLNLTL